MEFSLLPTKPQLQVFSAVCANFVAAWLVANFLTRDFFALTSNLILATISWKLAVGSEKLLEEHD